MIDIIRCVAIMPPTRSEEENAVKELPGDRALRKLWRGDFFDIAPSGGTSLRILHGLASRFSSEVISTSCCGSLIQGSTGRPISAGTLIEVFGQFRAEASMLPRTKMDTAIRQALIKNDSIKVSQLDLPMERAVPKTI